MKTLIRIFIGNAIIALLLSGIFWIIQLVLSLLPSVSSPDYKKFLWGALGIYILLVAYDIVTGAILFYHCIKDPMFRDAHMKTGMSWSDYKKYFRK